MKSATTSFRLQKVYPGDMRRSNDIGRMLEFVEGLPYDKPYKVTIEEAKSERSHKQNAYLWGVCYPLMADSSGYEVDDIHEECLKRHFGTRQKKVPKCHDYPEGLKEVPIRTTTTDESGRRSVLGKMAFAEYVERVRRIAAFMDCVIPDPDPSLVRDEPKPSRQRRQVEHVDAA